MPDTTLLLCRGCCCGTSPGFDHLAQEEALQAVDGVALRVVDCLDECDRQNVVVVRRPGLPRRERDLWLGGVTTAAATRALVAWLSSGGPLPRELAGRAFRHVAPAAKR